jgi:hypothetical protein
MKKYIVIAIFLISGISFAQKLNPYKYAIVPEKLTFLKQKNQYNLNELLKFAMIKYGFEPYFENDILPDDISNDNKVYVDVLENNSMFSTKVKIILKDFKNNILFTSNEGKSLDKSLEIAYNVALRVATNSLSSLKHVYTNNIQVTNLKETNVIYQAKSITNGYELYLDNNLIYKILKTSNKDFYKANKGDLQGTMFLKDNQYYFEYYSNDVLITEKLSINF